MWTLIKLLNGPHLDASGPMVRSAVLHPVFLYMKA
ncbi:hypothetical protein LINPERHAP2_LOCUS12052 [Linum perenne]